MEILRGLESILAVAWQWQYAATGVARVGEGRHSCAYDGLVFLAAAASQVRPSFLKALLQFTQHHFFPTQAPRRGRMRRWDHSCWEAFPEERNSYGCWPRGPASGLEQGPESNLYVDFYVPQQHGPTMLGSRRHLEPGQQGLSQPNQDYCCRGLNHHQYYGSTFCYGTRCQNNIPQHNAGNM